MATSTPAEITAIEQALAKLTPAEIADIEQQIGVTEGALATALVTKDFTIFNADAQKLLGTILTDLESPPCFVGGAMILTDRGEIAVENLSIGDLVVTLSGVNVPITWLGHRPVDCRRHPRPHEIMPVRVSANAFGENCPSRDLLLSPGHSVCVTVINEVLIPVSSLINDSSIVQEQVDQITYWHVELEGGHNVILAENLPCESYLEMQNRSFFAQGEMVSLTASPDALLVTHDDFCRPFHVGGPLVDVVRRQLAARVAELGWHHEVSGLDTCRLVVDGVSIAPKLRDMSLLFKIPAGASVVLLESSVGIPAELNSKSSDVRPLGVLVSRISVGDGYSSQEIAPDDARLVDGFHQAEMIDGKLQRWTAQRASLPSSLWDGMEDDLFFRIDVGSKLLPRWVKSERRPRLALAA